MKMVYDNILSGKLRSGMTTEELGQKIRDARKRQGLTQPALAMVSGCGVRFIVDLEAGKPTCQIAKVLAVIESLGMVISVTDNATL